LNTLVPLVLRAKREKHTMKLITCLLVLANAKAFCPSSPTVQSLRTSLVTAGPGITHGHNQVRPILFSSESGDGGEDNGALAKVELERKVGNLVADDEWMGLSMELTELVRMSVIEDIKEKTRDFLGSDDYKVGDISKELDSRVKDEVAKLRGKEEYELGDLSLALDQVAKDLTCELTGKDEYEFGDLSIELDKRIKSAVCDFCGKEDGQYEFGDLSKEIDRRAKNAVAEFTSKDDYEFGDISLEIERRRAEWVKDYLGKDDYAFGDITKKAISNFTGKENYEFGDISKKIVGGIFGKRKRGGSNNNNS